MRVIEVSLEGFRNLERQKVTLGEGVNVISGDNAQGKTNFLEALYLCATGHSQRAGVDREMVRFNQPEAHIKTTVACGNDTHVIDVHLFGDGRKKGIAVNHMPIRKLNDLFGLLRVVIFSPEDLRLVKSGPTERRVFIDMELCQLSAVYCHALRSYHHALKQRNKLLKAIQADRALLDTLPVWDEPLTRFGAQIMAQRQTFIHETGKAAHDIHKGMNASETLHLTYRPNIPDARAFPERLRRGVERDVALGSTSAGIHRDDVLFTINGNDTRVYGSQGQQRTAALAAKLAEIEVIKKHAGQSPVLLLDDVLSELDEKRQAFLLQSIGGLQTVLTCTGMEDVLKKININDAQTMHMEKGLIVGTATSRPNPNL
jgi:DNA replication and repair protein RecF